MMADNIDVAKTGAPLACCQRLQDVLFGYGAATEVLPVH